MTLDELLAVLAADAGRESPLVPDEDGVVHLEADGISLSFAEQDDYPVSGHRAILMWGRFGALPAEGADELVEEMLRLNDRADNPVAPAFALLEDGLYLQRTLSADLLDAEAVLAETADFLVELVEWRDRVAKACGRDAEDGQ